MLLKLNSHISNCLHRAAEAQQRASEATDPAIRSDHEKLAQSWRHLAKSYQFVESLELFIADKDMSKADALLLDRRLLGDKQTPLAEGRTIIPRPRVKHSMSFQERLLKSAQEAREQAAQLPAGAERDRLLLKAQQSETAADIDTWVSTPGSRPPDKLNLTKKPKA